MNAQKTFIQGSFPKTEKKKTFTDKNHCFLCAAILSPSTHSQISVIFHFKTTRGTFWSVITLKFLLDIINWTQLSRIPVSDFREADYYIHFHSSLPSLKELSTNRSLDNLDCLVSPLEAPPRHRNNDFSQCLGTLGRGSGTQVCLLSKQRVLI